MGFGFHDKDDVDDNEQGLVSFYTGGPILRHSKWEHIKKNLKVKSIMNGVSGVISVVNNPYVEIEWFNGNTSRARILDTTKVEIVDEGYLNTN